MRRERQRKMWNQLGDSRLSESRPRGIGWVTVGSVNIGLSSRMTPCITRVMSTYLRNARRAMTIA